MVVALGADLDPAATPGLLEGGHEFYTVAGAFALRDVLADFAGGRVIVGVPSTPFKCPPAPSETALLLHDYLVDRGAPRAARDRARDADSAADPAVAGRVGGAAAAFAERGIDWHPDELVCELDPERARSPFCATAARCPTTCSSACRCTGRPPWSWSRA